MRFLWYPGIPFLADQKRTVSKSVQLLGTAVYQDFHLITVENFKHSILKAVADPKILQKAGQVSRFFRDKPQKPLDLAVWWVDFVIRNPNLDNMRSPTLKLGFFASQSYDVLLVAIAALHIFLFAFYKALKFVNQLRKPKRKIE